MKPVDWSFDDIDVGQVASFRHVIVKSEVDIFAILSGDHNPLHTDTGYASTTEFGERVVHGMFLAALFSRLVGMYLPGRRCLYLSQSLDFVAPVFIGDMVDITGRVIQKQGATRTLVIGTEIYKAPSYSLAVRGKATVKVLDDYSVD